jgi:hypothetical protein
VVRQRYGRVVFGVGLQVVVPYDGDRTIVDQGPPVRACLRKRRRGKIIGRRRPPPGCFVEFLNTGSRESEMEPDGLVRDTVGAKIVPIDNDKKRDNTEPGEANPPGFRHVQNSSESQLRSSSSECVEDYVSLRASYADRRPQVARHCPGSLSMSRNNL